MSNRSSKGTNGSTANGWTKNKKSKIVSLRNLSDYTNQDRTAVDNDETLFQALPSEVHFSDYEAFSVHTATIRLRNKDTVARRVQVEPSSSHFFKISSCNRGKNANSKVAPGMEVQYTLTFKPESTNDHNVDLIVTTEREQFVIPVRACGERPKLSYPARVDFNNAPVNYTSTNPFLLRNYGPRPTAFTFHAPEPFVVTPASGFIEVGGAVSAKLEFTPTVEGPCSREMWIDLDEGVRMSSILSGSAESVDVRLEDTMLQCLPTYIQKLSQKTVRLFNRSDIPIDFKWRNLEAREEEQRARKEMMVQLALDEEHDRENIAAFIQNNGLDDVDDDLSEPSDEEDRAEYLRARAEQAITRKYRKARQELDEANFAFSHENYVIEPLDGQIWPNGEKTITVTFRPKAVTNYPVPAYCDVTGSMSRLPLYLDGLGVGPKAVFSYETLDIGEVYINAVHRYEISIENVGEIEAEFQLNAKSNSRFSFQPSSGVIQEGEETKISITFTSDQIGEFVEVLEWCLQGTIEPMKLTFKGKVIGPTFYFNEERLDFGLVSYGFLNSRSLTLHNTSQIPMGYTLRIPEDGKFMEREFGISPNTGNIMPGDKANIKVDFISETVKKYLDYGVVIDVDGVGQSLMNIPITAESQVSDVIINADTLDYGEVFLRHGVTRPIPMQNLSDNLHAKFEVQPQDTASQEVAVIMPERPTAAIPPASGYNLDVTLTTHRLGTVKLPVFIKVPGSGVPPKCITVTGTAIGPRVKLDKESLDWGKTFVLRNVPLTVTMTNDSPIPAEFKAFVHKKNSCFSVDPPVGRMKPFETMELTVTANLNEITKLTDILHILIHEGADLQVKLGARGVGTAIYSAGDIERIDHGNQFTNNVTTSTFTLENRGRRAQTLVWNYVPAEEENDPKAANKRRKNKKDDVELPPSIFAISPRKMLLEPMTSMEFTVTGMASKAGAVDEQWICGSLIGDAKEFTDIYTCRVAATFVDPLIEFSCTEVSFRQMNDPKRPQTPKPEVVIIKNIAALPLVFLLKVPQPFQADQVEFELQPGESASTSISFTAGIHGDRESAKIKSNLVVQYRDHPQKDKLPLFGEICFPNLSFESTKIDFGCIFNQTNKRMTKKITNNSQIEVKYEWAFYEDEQAESNEPINELFDILPIRGVLPPGASEDVEFVYYASIDSKVSGTAVCEVVGGPDYEISLAGESSNVAYRLDRTQLEFGAKEIGSFEERDLTLVNTGRVAFDFSVDLRLLKSSVVSVNPRNGRLNAGEKQKLCVRFDAKLPSHIKETFEVIVAFFDPQPVEVRAVGVYPNAILSLPRNQTDKWKSLLADATTSLEEKAAEDAAEEVEEKTPVKMDESRLLSSTPRTVGARSRAPTVVVVPYRPPEIPAALKSQNPQVEVHLEADRLCYFAHANNLLKKKADGTKTAKKKTKLNEKKDSFVISNYVCDFGNVILGQSKQQRFKVTNTGPSPITFDINKRPLTGTVFSIEPMQVMRLPPGETVEFLAACTTNSRKHKQEAVSVPLPIAVRSGPEVRVLFKANITIPGLEISNNKLDFGPVYVGQRKEITVQLHNVKEVPCEWSLKSISTSNNNKDVDSWSCFPEDGVLAPGGRQNIVIAFQPTEKKRMTAKIPIRINMNPKGVNINCKGGGLTVGLGFNPGNVALGPVLPYQTSEPMEVQLVNNGNKDIEVYSLDFDTQYLAEEDILRGDESYVDGVMYVTPRNPGEVLPTHILKAHRKREKKREQEAERARLAAIKAAEEAERKENEAESGAEDEKKDEGEPEGGDAAEGDVEVGQLVNEEEVVDEDEEEIIHNILITGDPLSGKTKLAKSVGELLDLTDNIISSFDEVVRWSLGIVKKIDAHAKEQEEFKRIRESGNKKEREFLAQKEAEGIEEPKFSEEDIECSRAMRTVLDAHRNITAEREPQPRAASPAKSKRSKPNTGKAEAKPVEEGFKDCVGKNVLSQHLLIQALRLFSLQERFSNGIIFDGTENSFVSSSDLAVVIKKAFDELGAVRENNLHLVNLRIDYAAANERLQLLNTTYSEFMEDKDNQTALKKFKVLGDKDLAKLSGDKLTKYEETLVLYHKRAEATAFLEKLDESQKRLDAFYNQNQGGDEEEPAADVDAAAAEAQEDSAETATAVKHPAIHFKEFLDAFGLIHPQVDEDGTVAPVEEEEEPAAEEKAASTDSKSASPSTSPTPTDTSEVKAEADANADANAGGDAEETADSTHLQDVTVEALDTLRWVKAKVFGVGEFEQIEQKLHNYIQDVFYVEVDPSLKDPSWVPPEKVHQLIHYPEVRMTRPPANNFYFVNKEVTMPKPPVVEEEPPARKTDSRKGKRKGKDREPTPEPVPSKPATPMPLEPIISYVRSKQTRWVIPAKSSQTVLVQFLSDCTGRFAHSLGFEIVGNNKQYELAVRGTCAVPEIAQEPRSVFMRRVKSRKHNMIVHRQYVQQDRVFDFGPLIIGKDPNTRNDPPTEDDFKHTKTKGKKKNKDKKVMSAVRRTNGETFRITNTGLFDLNVDFAFRDAINSVVVRPEVADEPVTHKKAKAPTKGKGKDKDKKGKKGKKEEVKEDQGPLNDPTQPIFIVEPASLTIPVDEMCEVTVWSFPQDVGHFDDVLVCSVKDNPMAIQFPVRCEGAKPTVELSACNLEFDRLLMGQTDTKDVEIKNVSNVPVVWSLKGLEDLGEELSITPHMDGIINPQDTAIFTVNFKAIEQQEYTYTIPLEVRDAEGILGMVDVKPIEIKAEAFKMDAAVEIPEKGLDFSVIRVNDAEKREFKIVNQGKYNIKYGFSTAPKSQALFAEILKIEPDSGDLAPGQEQVIVVTAKTSAEETVKCSDLKLHLIEGGTDEVVRTIPIHVNLRSVFSQFRLLPVHGVNFGPLEMGITKTKKMQICNDGEFEFLFRVFPAKDREKFPKVLGAPDPEEENSKDKKKGKKTPGKKDKKSGRKKGAADEGGENCNLGPFLIQPTEGSIPPGSSIDISVTMEATSMESYLEVLEVDISQRGFVHPGGHMADANRLKLDLTGESCSPGVETSKWDSIFEEQPIMNKISGRIVDKNFFALEERAFVFAPVIANQRTDAVRSERFRISNPFKVACNVNLRVFNQGGRDKDGGGASSRAGKKAPAKKGKGKDDAGAVVGGYCPFVVDPVAIHIPNHEHRYVTVSFNPTALQAYNAVFEATVDKGSDPATRQLSFELRGEGTLPHLTIAKPTVRDEEGLPLFSFDRVFCHPKLNRSQTLPMTLYNPGIVPATCRFDMPPTSQYTFSGLGKMVVIDPGKEHNLSVTFHPKQPGEHERELKMSILQNPFEQTTFKLTGNGYLEDVALELGDEVMGDELNFGDVPVGEGSSKMVTLVNYSDFPYKFNWETFTPAPVGDDKGPKGKGAKKKGHTAELTEPPPTPDFVLSPSCGHVQPHSTKTVKVTFLSGAPRQHDKVPVRCELSKIRYLTLEERKALRSVPAAKAAKGKDKGKGKKGEPPSPKPEEPELEPYDLDNMEWDDTMKISMWVSEEIPTEQKEKEEAPKGKGKGKKDDKMSKKEEEKPMKLVEVIETAPEPEHEVVGAAAGQSDHKDHKGPAKDDSQTTKELSTLLSVVCDRALYEMKVKSVNFRPTMMFQTREFKFPIKNTSTINLNYQWRIVSFRHNSKIEDVEVVNPFTITNMDGTISPGDEDYFTVQFSPLDSLAYSVELEAQIANLPADCEVPRVKLRGSGQRPKCHFELVNSDYLSANRRQVGLPGPGGSTGPLDPAYRVIEFKSLGVKVRNTRRFYVVNPTNVSYAFQWRCEDSTEGQSANPFRCTTTSGIVESGRKFEMVFQFIPEVDQLVESFWRFEIVDHNINIPILLAGSVAEPDVRLDRSNLKFEPLMLNRRQTETVNLVNNEHIPFHFTIDKSSIRSGGIDVKPLSGVVGPNQSMPINLTFLPKREQDYNWNVLFNIRNKPGRVALNVKGEGYAVNANVNIKDAAGHLIDLYEGEVNRVGFGAVHIFEKRVKTVLVANEGKYTFSYKWALPSNRFVTISPISGTVRAGSKAEVEISYYTATEASVDNLQAVLTIANSARYALSISGRGKKPSLEFSFLQHEFGKSFVNDAGFHDEFTPMEQTLRIVNHEHDQNVAIDMLFDPNSFLKVPPTACVMAPAEAIEVPLKFTPTDARKYRQMVPFEVNGLYKVNVLVTGEGTPLKLELADPAQQSVNFGQVRMGGSVQRSVTIVNHSRKTVTFALSQPKSNNNLVGKYLTMYPQPDQQVSLRPKDSLRVELMFEPEVRMPHFTAEVLMHAHGVTRRLLLLSGACHGVGMRLESDKLPFGNVVEHSSLTKKVKLSNTGDVGTNYKWVENYKPHFSIEPSEGFLAPGGGVTMEVTFHPAFVSPDIRFNKVPCLVDGVESPDMYLTLSGGCLPQAQEGIEELKFTTKVRNTETQTVKITNPTEKRWAGIRPSIQNDFWTGENSIDVPANGEATYTINFTPLSMTKEAVIEAEEGTGKKSGRKGKDKRPSSKKDKRPKSGAKGTDRSGRSGAPAEVKDLGNNDNRPAFHEGSLFFPLPNGKALSYKLVGYASFPEPEGVVTVEVPAKKQIMQPLSIRNWLSEYQRFKVIVACEQKDEGVTISGSDTVDVPGLTERTHKLQFFAFKEGTTKATVTFLNESTGESMSYSLVFNVTPGEAESSIPPLITPIRQLLVQHLVIRNPLPSEAIIDSFKCDESSVFVPTPITIPARSTGKVPVQFRPLLAHEAKETTLVLPCATLGEFKYGLNLTCTPHVAERSLRFNANLGSEAKQTFRFISYAPNPTDYECSVTGTHFGVDSGAKISAAAAAPDGDGVEVVVELRYEPSAVGTVRETFTANSPTGGKYSCVLYGICEMPKPQGPIVIPVGQSATVRFKNVLDLAETFNFSVDHSSFILAKKTERLNSKASAQISVQFKPEDWVGAGKGKGKAAAAAPVEPSKKTTETKMAKLLVSCPNAPKLSWVFYLQGIIE